MQLLKEENTLLKEQISQDELKISYREEALKRLQLQQNDCLDEVSRREKAIEKLELDLFKAHEEIRENKDEVLNWIFCVYFVYKGIRI